MDLKRRRRRSNMCPMPTFKSHYLYDEERELKREPSGRKLRELQALISEAVENGFITLARGVNNLHKMFHDYEILRRNNRYSVRARK